MECDLFDKSINAGSRVRFYEIVMGMDYDVTGTIVRVMRMQILSNLFFKAIRKQLL